MLLGRDECFFLWEMDGFRKSTARILKATDNRKRFQGVFIFYDSLPQFFVFKFWGQVSILNLYVCEFIGFQHTF